MADRKNGALIWGVLLILFGIGFLMQSLGLFVGMGALVWAGFMAFGGLVFLYLKAQSAENWWGLIPGLALLGLAALIAWDAVWPESGLGVVAFMGGFSLGFWAVYLDNRERWWAMIPGGVLAALALMLLAEALNAPVDEGGLFLLLMGVSFVVVALFSPRDEDTRWAFIPAGVLGFIGLVILLESAELAKFVVPAGLLGGGIYLLARGYVRGEED
jgi:hypothetical protein